MNLVHSFTFKSGCESSQLQHFCLGRLLGASGVTFNKQSFEYWFPQLIVITVCGNMIQISTSIILRCLLQQFWIFRVWEKWKNYGCKFPSLVFFIWENLIMWMRDTVPLISCVFVDHRRPLMISLNECSLSGSR